MIKISNLTKRYGDKLAVDDVSFNVDKGDIVGFLGRNGAGKTTTMNIVTGYISCTSGSVTVDGYDVLENPMEVKRRIGYMPEQPPLYLDMTVNDYLDFACQIKGVEKPLRKKHIDEITDIIRITDVRKRIIGNLSKGYKQRVGLAQTLVGNPPVLILDEPTVGLDPRQIVEIKKLIKQLGKHHTIVLSSHILSEISDVCDKVVIINHGRVVAQDKIEDLRRGISGISRLSLRVAGSGNAAVRALREITGVKKAEQIGSFEPETVDIMVETDKQTDIRRQVFAAMGRINAPILQMRYLDLSLEDIFLQLTSDAKEEKKHAGHI